MKNNLKLLYKSRALFLVVSMLFPAVSFSQVGEPEYYRNYINKAVFTDTVKEIDIYTQSEISYLEESSFFDGLGYEVANVKYGYTTSGLDFIEKVQYDELGRVDIKHKPYATTLETEDELYSTGIEIGDYGMAITVYDNSPLGRAKKQGYYGEAWQPTGVNGGHCTEFSYDVNTSNEVKQFTVGATGGLSYAGDYGEATLFKNGVSDENGVWSYEYKNSLGQAILKTQDSLNLKTYYVYDGRYLLRYVVPPKAAEEIENQGAVTTEILNNLCYYYAYDEFERLVKKKLPGADTIYMVYDDRDRLVLTQDGNLRAENKWMFTKYDAFNRPVLTGIYSHHVSIGQDRMQTIVNGQMVNFYEEIDGNYSSADFGYTNQSFPTANMEVLTVTYYDNYNFDVNAVGTYANVRAYAESIDDADYNVSGINYNVKGQVTGTLVKVLNESKYLLSVNLYDGKYRVVRTYTENYLGGDDLLLTKYGFTGNVLATKQVHFKDAVSGSVVINQRMVYSHALRLDSVFYEIGDNGEICMAALEYNDSNELITKKLHDGLQNGNFLQEINYQYNERGWLTGINDPGNLSDDLFAMQLAYNDGITGLTTTAQYNGNISAMEWANSSETVNHAYAFDYDNVNRLIKGDHFENSAVTTNFDLASVSYDANGNIEALSRFGDTGKHIDDLSYAYNNTNQLQSVSDIATSKAEGFADGVGKTLEYDYDSNGNLIFDDNKGIVDIRYNYLNLPARIWFGTGDSINYIYDAAGVKHAKLVSGTETNSNKYYIGNMEYNHTQDLEFIHTGEGRIRINGSEYYYDYYLKDHLGNTRVVFTEDTINAGFADTLQVTNYYPFGMRFNQAPVYQSQENNYLYNGKEIQNDYGLDWYDYGKRMYDAALGRFHTLDPMAEVNHVQSPFAYADNNPLRFIDFMGMDAIGAYGTSLETSSYDYYFFDDPLKKKDKSEVKNNVVQTQGSDMDGWGDEAPVEEDTGNPYAVKSKVKTDKENDELSKAGDEYVEAFYNTLEQQEIKEKNAASTQKMEDRFKKQENFVAGVKKVGEGTVYVVSTVAEGFVGIVTGILFSSPLINEQQNYVEKLPDEI